MLRIEKDDSPESLAYKLLGDTRMEGQLFIPGWHKDLPLPVGQNAYIKDLPIGLPSKNWTKPLSVAPRQK